MHATVATDIPRGKADKITHRSSVHSRRCQRMLHWSPRCVRTPTCVLYSTHTAQPQSATYRLLTRCIDAHCQCKHAQAVHWHYKGATLASYDVHCELLHAPMVSRQPLHLAVQRRCKGATLAHYQYTAHRHAWVNGINVTYITAVDVLAAQ